jgi:hypothetical protein
MHNATVCFLHVAGALHCPARTLAAGRVQRGAVELQWQRGRAVRAKTLKEQIMAEEVRGELRAACVFSATFQQMLRASRTTCCMRLQMPTPGTPGLRTRCARAAARVRAVDKFLLRFAASS